MICSEASNVVFYDLHTITRLSIGCRNLRTECKATYIFYNFLAIWDKVALNESDIVLRLTKITKNTVLPDTEYFENRVPKLPSGCSLATS